MIKFVTCDRPVVFSESVSSINKTDHHDITEILLKMVLNIITLTLKVKIINITIHTPFDIKLTK